MSRETDAGRPRSRGVRQWTVLVVAVLFALLYAYDLFEAISNLVGVTAQLDAYNAFAEENGLTPAAVPWALLVATIALPPVAYATAAALGRGRSIGMRALLFAAGLTVVAALTLSLIALA